MISKLKILLKNLLSPARHSFKYQKSNGDWNWYIVTNCTALKGCDSTTYANGQDRARGINKTFFKAKCLNRNGGVRSFYFNKVQEVRKLSLLEEAAQ
jgi:hypothetical protein